MKDAEKPAIITGSTASVKTMADDTLRVTIDIEPRHAQAAFAMFGMRGTPVAVARLTPVAAVAESQPKPQQEDYGKHYEMLYRRGWWHNPRVCAAFDVPLQFEPNKRIERIKELIYEAFSATSLAGMDPRDFRDWLALDEMDIADTLPREFGEAA